MYSNTNKEQLQILNLKINNLPRISAKGQRLNYSRISFRQFQIIMDFLLEHNDENLHILTKVSNRTGVCYNTLRSWQNSLKQNPSFNPKTDHDLKHRAMSPRLEEQIVTEIEKNFLIPGLFFNMDNHNC